jgi:23S rRNA (adenine2503-C2)-methyltransferase
MTSAPVHLLGMNQQELEEFVSSLGERAYRGRQLFHWLYERGADSFEAMTDLPKPLRGLLASCARLEPLRERARSVSAGDGTAKFLFELSDGRAIETVLIPPARSFENVPAVISNRLTLCVSTQVGCPLDCTFCATATMGFARNLTAGEIVDQVRQVRHLSQKRITNVVFMGMGEPLLNYESVLRAVELLSLGMEIAARRITLSTAGWVPGILRLAEEGRQVKLAVSLHSAVEETRRKLMPVTPRYGLRELADAVAHYYRETRARVTYEVIFFDGINDSDRDVEQLIGFARRTPSKINVIPFHAIAGAGVSDRSLRPSPRMHQIVDRLRARRLIVMVRSSAGEDIDAACGQLAVRTERGAPHARSAATTGAFQT